MSKADKKRYLKALNRRLKKEAGKSDARFIFDPPGAKPKDATGVQHSKSVNLAMLTDRK